MSVMPALSSAAPNNTESNMLLVNAGTINVVTGYKLVEQMTWVVLDMSIWNLIWTTRLFIWTTRLFI